MLQIPPPPSGVPEMSRLHQRFSGTATLHSSSSGGGGTGRMINVTVYEAETGKKIELELAELEQGSTESLRRKLYR